MIPAGDQIRDLTTRRAAVLAQMAGVTDTLIRRVIRGLGGCGALDALAAGKLRPVIQEVRK